jgi:hypothetical protein
VGVDALALYLRHAGFQRQQLIEYLVNLVASILTIVLLILFVPELSVSHSIIHQRLVAVLEQPLLREYICHRPALIVFIKQPYIFPLRLQSPSFLQKIRPVLLYHHFKMNRLFI